MENIKNNKPSTTWKLDDEMLKEIVSGQQNRRHDVVAYYENLLAERKASKASKAS